MQDIVEVFRQNLQLAYENAKQTDDILQALSEQGLGKFNAIFPKDAGFNCEANRLVPYVEDISMRFYDATHNGAKEKISPTELAVLADLLKKIFVIQAKLAENTIIKLDEN
ncbi:hypothetical protein [Algibacillus agarilyticus]|uniref:hypothetical protein n=1 Tax=Algibacillus agarilyticus TaxID=2234133 RepID=UPI000DD0979F|nr:hypothetical protein [Algibacillus agarilyticus]